MIDGIIRINESDPAIILSPTVPVSCPPCSMTVNLESYAGLKVSHCSVTFSAWDPPMTSKTITIEPVKTPGSFSRVVRIVFSAFKTTFPGSPWDHYTPAHCPVCMLCYRDIILPVLVCLSHPFVFP